MKTLKESMVEVISAECTFDYPVSVYMNHITIDIPDNADSYSTFKDTESEIRSCVYKNIAERDEDVLICLKKDGEQHNFKIWRTDK